MALLSIPIPANTYCSSSVHIKTNITLAAITRALAYLVLFLFFKKSINIINQSNLVASCLCSVKQRWVLVHQRRCRLVMGKWCSPEYKPYSEGLHWSILPLWSQLRTLCIMQRLHYFSRNTGPGSAPPQADLRLIYWLIWSISPLSGILIRKYRWDGLLFNLMCSILCRTHWIKRDDLQRTAI